MGLNLNFDFDVDNDRGLTLTECENIDFLLYRDEYKYTSYFILSYRKGKEFKGNAGNICSQYRENDFIDELPKDYDIYICPNGTRTPKTRSSENLINIQNFVIDIDAHNTKLNADELNIEIDKIINAILDKVKVKPNFINRTGRGIHLWYCIEPCHITFRNTVCCGIDMICQEIEYILSHTYNFKKPPLELDKAASLKLNGLFRFPYSYNTKSNSWSNGELIHTEISNINDIRKTMYQAGYKSEYSSNDYQLFVTKKKKPKKKFNPKYKRDGNDWSGCIFHRKQFLEYLFNTGRVQRGRRMSMLFMMYNILVQLYDTEDANERIRELNESLTEPLPYNELRTMFKTFKFKDKPYNRITNKGFLKLINATDDEIEYFNKSTNARMKEEQKRQAKKEKYNQVIELFNQGMKKTDIAKTLNISRPTIDKIIRESV